MATHKTRDRKLTPQEAAKYRQARAEIEAEKPEIIEKALRARREMRRKQLVGVMEELKAAREAAGMSLADVQERTGIDRSALSKLENITNENPTMETLLRYAEVVGKRIEIHIFDR